MWQNTLNMHTTYINLSHFRDPAKMSIRLQFPQCRRPHGASYLEEAGDPGMAPLLAPVLVPDEDAGADAGP